MFKKNKKSLAVLLVGFSTVLISSIAVAATACARKDNNVKEEGKTTLNKLISKKLQNKMQLNLVKNIS